MAFKRPFDDEEVEELPTKHSRQLDSNNKPTEFAEVVPCSNIPQRPGLAGEDKGSFCKSHEQEACEYDTVCEGSDFVYKDFVTSPPFPLVTCSSSEEDTKSGATTQSSLSQEYSELDIPQRTVPPLEDAYSLLMDRSPRRQVPLGPNHQAKIPLWNRHTKEENLDQSDASHPSHTIDNDDEKLMGACIIPMCNSITSRFNVDKAGEGRKDCTCLDAGSVRCVQQHIMEAREKLVKTIGYENFVNLGFCDMGEEVAHRWSEDEEQLFHEVVYSNPVSLGQNFWKHLAAVFPCRTKREIVSYYFNVFMLRRRAAQNRSNLLEIDSDDDEWHGSYGGLYEVHSPEEDEDSAIESPFHQNIQPDPNRVYTFEEDVVEDCINEQDEFDDDDEDDDDGDDDNFDGDVGDSSGGDTEGDSVINNVSESNIVRSTVDGRFDCVAKMSGNIGEFNVQDDSCMSFELQPDSCVPADAKMAMHSNVLKTDPGKCLQNKVDGCNDPVGQVYLFESCDARVWDARYPTGPMKDVEFLPTCNIIEEIFGPDTRDNKTGNN